jgi:glutamate formiminotransferase
VPIGGHATHPNRAGMTFVGTRHGILGFADNWIVSAVKVHDDILRCTRAATGSGMRIDV